MWHQSAIFENSWPPFVKCHVKSEWFSLTWSCGSRQRDTTSSGWKFTLNNLAVKGLKKITKGYCPIVKKITKGDWSHYVQPPLDFFYNYSKEYVKYHNAYFVAKTTIFRFSTKLLTALNINRLRVICISLASHECMFMLVQYAKVAHGHPALNQH